MSRRELFEFGDFTLDVPERRLLRGSVPVHLPPKTHDVLVELVRDAGRLVTKDDLLARVWPETFVEKAMLLPSGEKHGVTDGSPSGDTLRRDPLARSWTKMAGMDDS